MRCVPTAALILTALAAPLGAAPRDLATMQRLPAAPAVAVPARMDSELAAGLADRAPLAALAARGFRVADGRVQVAVDCAPGALAVVRAWLEAAAAVEVSSHARRLQADVPMSLLTGLVSLPGVEWVGRPLYAELPEPAPPAAAKTALLVESEALAVMNAAAWHGRGITGGGVKVGVIDSQLGGYEALVDSELPGAERLHYRRFGGTLVDDEVHGTACAEIVHDVAPDAEIYLALVSSTTDVANAVAWMQGEGVRVITMSLTWLSSGPGDGTGVVAAIIEDFVAADGIWLNSAGNYRSSHWQGPAVDGDGDGWVETASGDEAVALSGTVAAGTELRAYLVWDDWEVTDQDYSFHLVSLAGGEPVEVAVADRLQAGQTWQQPWEQLNFTVVEAGSYALAVRRKAATEVNDLEIIVVDQYLEEPVESGSITPPSDSAAAVAVAALGTSTPYGYRVFSSAGPTNGPGGTLAGGAVKPDLGGYDGVSTASYGPRAYYGTSAASPHVAGAAALVLSAHPEWSSVDVRAFLEGAAIDKGEVGKDNDYGHGRLILGAAPGQDCSFTVTPTALTVGASGGNLAVQVATAADCFWTAESASAWLTATPDGRTGPGIVLVTVAANAAFEARSGSVVVAGQTVVVEQAAAACTVTVTPTELAFAADGGSASVEVAAPDGCAWQAASDAAWLTVDSGVSGVGDGEVVVTAEANPDAELRAAALTVAGTAVAVTQEAAAQRVIMVAGVAATAGSGGTAWSTSLAITNRADETASLRLHYYHEGEMAAAAISMGAGQIWELEDVVRTLFGVSGDSAGSVEVASAYPLLVSARTFNTTADGTFGQFLPGVVEAEALGDDAVAVLSQIKQTADFRTNIGAVNLRGTEAQLELRLYDGDGATLGNPLTLTVAGHGWAQRNRVFTAAGVAACEIGYATVSVLTPGAEVWAYASVVDEHSGDPTTVPMVALPANAAVASRSLVAGIAATAGDAGTRWRSNLAALNPGSGEATVTLTYRHQGGSVEATASLAAGQIVEWRDVAAGLFAVSGDSAGAVEVVADRPLVVTARTFNDTPDGTFGQFLPGVDEAAALTAGELALLPQLTSDDDFRSNLGVVNLGAEEAAVEVVLVDGDGLAVGSPVTLTVPAGAWVQRNRIFAAAGVASCPIGYARVRATTPGARVWAYASVVDNHSGDPTTVPQTVEAAALD